MNDGLAIEQINRMKSALAEIQDIHGALDFIDKAKAAKILLDAAGMDEHANEVKIAQMWAERRAGEILLYEIPKAQGGEQYHQDPTGDTTSPVVPTYEELGISKKQASRWQQIAEIPREEFEEHLAEYQEQGKEVTQASVLKLAREIKREEKQSTPEPPPEPNTVRWSVQYGDIWRLGRHLLLCGDAYSLADMARLVGDSVVDALISDPPYGIDYQPDWRKWDGTPGEFQKVTGDDMPFDPRPFLNYPTVALFGADNFSHLLPPGGWVCWDKRTDEKKDAMFGSPFELAWFASVNTTRRAIMIRVLHGGVVNADSQVGNNEKRFVSTQKPVKMMAALLHDITRKDDCILDPFAGSGSTLLAAEKTGRSCLVMEIEPDAASIIVARWAEMTGGEPCRLE